jgi:hypothetical protein
MYLGVRFFIAVIFVVTGLSFLATTATLMWEFWRQDWLGLAAFYSHLFVFFPTFGVLALVAFYLPACVFLDMYWRHIPYGRQRFTIGFLAVVALSIFTGYLMRQSLERSVFEVAPPVLAADKGEGCSANGSCQRLPVLKALDNIRVVSQKRIGLSDLVRNCTVDPLLEEATERLKVRRFCFATTPYSDQASRLADSECCVAQKRMLQAVNSYYDMPGQRSLTGIVHGYLLPFNIFFLLMMLTISLMMAFRRKSLETHYAAYLPGIERGVLIGAAGMVIYPVMVQAYLQAASLIFGSETPGGFRSFATDVSLGFGGFALLLLFFFYRRRNRELQSVARVAGVVGSGVALLKYDQIIDIFVRVFGSGAGWTDIAVLIVLVLGSIVALFVQTSREIDGTMPVDKDMLAETSLSEVEPPAPQTS